MGFLARTRVVTQFLVILASCTIDFRAGLSCNSHDDCHGYLCSSGKCSPPGAKAATPKCTGSNCQAPNEPMTAKPETCAPCIETSDGDECDQSMRPQNSSVECVGIVGFGSTPQCRINTSGIGSVCDAFIETTSGRRYCACPGEIAETGGKCGPSNGKVCRVGTRPSPENLCVSSVCRKTCATNLECSTGFACQTTSNGGRACLP